MNDHSRQACTRMADIVLAVVRGLVDDEESVAVRVVEEEGHTRLRVTVAPRDFGKVIGHRGQNVNALRFLMNAVGNKFRLPWCENGNGETTICAHIYVEDPNPERRGSESFSPLKRTR